MGSQGSGNFSDYPGGGSQSSSSSGEDRCHNAVPNVELEEIEQCNYYSKKNNVPEKNTELRIILSTRLEAVDKRNLVVGYLPTKFNYLAGCIKSGFNYIGVVNHASSNPTSRVIIDIAKKLEN